MRQAQVFYQYQLAGLLSENEEGYFFVYESQYLENSNSKPVSLTLPLQKAAFQSKILFPFFDGLIPEGWLLNIAIDNWKINPRDRFGLLLSMCRDCIGCISIIPNEN
jgi:serine/threonine-protein kinase HipA